MSDKLWLNERITAWTNANTRAFWLLCGDKPKGCDLSRVHLQRVFKNTALASPAVVEQLSALAGLDVTAFVPQGAEPSTAGTIAIEKRFAILVKVLILVIGRDVTSVGGKARVEKLCAAFEDGVEMVTSHGDANHQAIQLPIHKKRIARFINKDLEDLPAVVLPTWSKIAAYIDAGRLEHVDTHKDPVATREKGGRAVKRARRDTDCARLPCFGWASQCGCRFERKGDRCKYRHDPADKFRGEK